MSATERTYVLKPELTDVSMVRDPGMQALIILARSLGWNMMHKNQQPVVITARNGTQKRIPTNTSIRISVFQTTLASIILHSEDTVPTIELVDAIIRLTKLDHDHARRMRAAVHEDEGVLADRVLNSAHKEGPLDQPDQEVNFDKESYLKTLQPQELLDRKPTTEDFDAWMGQIGSLPWVTTVSRRGTIIDVTTEDGDRQFWCAFPGCRYPWNYDANAIRGHVRLHSTKWGPISDTETAQRRSEMTAARQKALRDQGFELGTSGHIRGKPEGVRSNAEAAAIMLGGPVPDVIATEAAKQKAIAAPPGMKPEAAALDLEPSYPPVGSDLVDRFTTDALALLDIANRFVATLDEVTKALGPNARIAELEAEVAKYKEKADRYDIMREAFRE